MPAPASPGCLQTRVGAESSLCNQPAPFLPFLSLAAAGLGETRAEQQRGPLLLSLLRAARLIRLPCPGQAAGAQASQPAEPRHLDKRLHHLTALYVSLVQTTEAQFSFLGPPTSIACSVPALRAGSGLEPSPCSPPTTLHGNQATRSSRDHVKQPPEAGFDVAMSLSVISFSSPFIHW